MFTPILKTMVSNPMYMYRMHFNKSLKETCHCTNLQLTIGPSNMSSWKNKALLMVINVPTHERSV